MDGSIRLPGEERKVLLAVYRSVTHARHVGRMCCCCWPMVCRTGMCVPFLRVMTSSPIACGVFARVGFARPGIGWPAAPADANWLPTVEHWLKSATPQDFG